MSSMYLNASKATRLTNHGSECEAVDDVVDLSQCQLFGRPAGHQRPVTSKIVALNRRRTNTNLVHFDIALSASMSNLCPTVIASSRASFCKSSKPRELFISLRAIDSYIAWALHITTVDLN